LIGCETRSALPRASTLTALPFAESEYGDRVETDDRIQPELSVRRGREAVEFYKAAFGAVEIYRVGGIDEHEPVVSQLTVGDASFWVSDESPSHGNFSPESLGGGTVRILLIVDDPDAVVGSAVVSGATVIDAVGEEHGWLLGRIQDPFGHHWEIGKPLGPWPPPGDAHVGA
jgi:PhnB protein